MGSICNWRRSL